MENIGGRVRAARQERGFTMKQLHELSGLSTGNISDIENGKNTPSVQSLIPLSRALGKPVEWILTGEGPDTRASEQGPTCDGTPLSELEAGLVAMFRLLDTKSKENAFDFVTMMYEKATGEKGSIYSTYIDDENAQRSGPDNEREARTGTA